MKGLIMMWILLLLNIQCIFGNDEPNLGLRIAKRLNGPIEWMLDEPSFEIKAEDRQSKIDRFWNKDESSSVQFNSTSITSSTMQQSTSAALSESQSQLSTSISSLSSETTTAKSSISSSSISMSTMNTPSAPSQTIPTFNSYFTQEALHVQDNSKEVAANLKDALRDPRYSDLFDNKLTQMGVEALNDDDLDLVTSAQQYVEKGRKGVKRPFLFTGKAQSRTRRNCYMMQLRSSITADQVDRLKEVIEKIGGTVGTNYHFGKITGMTACFPPNKLPLNLLKRIAGIEHVERDQYFTHMYVQEQAPWQLARLNNEKLNLEATFDSLSTKYLFNATGKGVNVYLIDSGVMPDHPEFEGRASVGFSIFGNGFPNDCAGHGTQVSSVMGGKNVGVAKKANIIVAQVLDCDGQGENSSVLSALSWISANHQAPAVINMSVGGPKSPSVDEAVEAIMRQGIPVVVAAGNSMIDACNLSPSGVRGDSLVVGASTREHARADFSNFGSCVDIFAPGRHVIAAGIPGQATKNGFMFVSGTSLSAPLMTGIYALLLEYNPKMTPGELKATAIAIAAKGVLNEQTLMGSPNVLAQTPALPATPDLTFSFLPGEAYPTYGVKVSSSHLESIIIIVSAALGGICLAIIGIVLISQRWKRHRQRRRSPSSSLFQ